MLVVDYGYADSKMYETLQAVNNHKYSNILDNRLELLRDIIR